MSASVHDNVLVSYEVLCEERKIVLHTELRERKQPEHTRVVFTGVEAYRFENDTLGSILSDIEAVAVGDFLKERRAEVLEAARCTAWPWAKDLDAAPKLLAEKGVKGFVVSSACGMTGWVLAQTAAIGSTTEIDASTNPGRPGVYALASDGSRAWLDATGVVVAFGDGRELVVSLSSHPASRAGVMLRSEYSGPGQRAGESGVSREIYTAITLHPGGGNVMRAVVTARRGRTGEVVAGDGEGDAAAAEKSYFLVRGEQRVVSEATSFLFDCGGGRVLQLDPPTRPTRTRGASFYAGPPATKEDFERVKAGGPHVTSSLGVRFGGCNVVHVEVSPSHASQPFRVVSPKAET